MKTDKCLSAHYFFPFLLYIFHRSVTGVDCLLWMEFGLSLTHAAVAYVKCALGECMPREGIGATFFDCISYELQSNWVDSLFLFDGFVMEILWVICRLFMNMV